MLCQVLEVVEQFADRVPIGVGPPIVGSLKMHAAVELGERLEWLLLSDEAN